MLIEAFQIAEEQGVGIQTAVHLARFFLFCVERNGETVWTDSIARRIHPSAQGRQAGFIARTLSESHGLLHFGTIAACSDWPCSSSKTRWSLGWKPPVTWSSGSKCMTIIHSLGEFWLPTKRTEMIMRTLHTMTWSMDNSAFGTPGSS